MKTARTISYAMTIAGAILAGASALLNLGAVATLTGMLLVVAGVVKIAMVAIWKSFFTMPIANTVGPADKSGNPRGAGELHEV